MRVYSDEAQPKGARMEIDLFAANGDDFVTCLAEVVWVREIPGHDPAGYDLGLRFLDIPESARAMIEKLAAEADAREQR